MVENLNEEDIKKQYLFLGHQGVSEVRPILPRWHENSGSPPPSIFIKNVDEFISICKKYNGTHNVYVGLNERSTQKKNDDDVKFITNIGHDIDAHQSGEEGYLIAGQVALKIREDCLEKGYKEPLILSSGRGFWVIHHISPIDNTEENEKKIKEFGKRIKEKYEQDKIEMDSVVYNPSRIVRVAGTLNVSIKEKYILSSIANNPLYEEDIKLRDDILAIEIKKYTPVSSIGTPTLNSFMDYCLTHEVPKGERHKVISRHIALYIAKHPDREILKEQYIKIQKGSETELDQYLKQIDENGVEKYPFSIGELVNFTRKYKIPFDWKQTNEYKQFIREKKAEKILNKEIIKEERAEQFGKAIKFFRNKLDLAEQFLKVQPLYYDKAKIWWIWDFKNKYWDMCDEVDILNYISKESEADTINSKDKNEILEALKQVSRKNKPEPIKKSWVQFKNGIIDLENNNLEVIEPEPKYFTTNPILWDLGSSEETPMIDKLFDEWVGAENKQILYEIMAYCMLSDYPIHRLFCFVGEGLNGKGTYLRLLTKLIGQHNCATAELDTLLRSNFETTRLYKKLCCQMGETNFNEMGKTSKLKSLTGGDLIGFEFKHKDGFEDYNYAKIIISTNSLPTTSDKTIGFYRRWLIIDFPKRFSEKADVLKDIPDVEFENLSLKCIKILKNLLDKREFYKEGSIEERAKRFEERSNPFDKFFNEFVEEDGDKFVTKNSFEKRLNEWCEINKYRQLTETTINQKMKEKQIYDGRKDIDWFNGNERSKKQARVWLGIRWK